MLYFRHKRYNFNNLLSFLNNRVIISKQATQNWSTGPLWFCHTCMHTWHRSYIHDGILFVPLLTWVMLRCHLPSGHPYQVKAFCGRDIFVGMGGLLLDANVSIAATLLLSYILRQDTPTFLFTPLSLEQILSTHGDAMCFQERNAWHSECHVFVDFSCHLAVVFQVGVWGTPWSNLLAFGTYEVSWFYIPPFSPIVGE